MSGHEDKRQHQNAKSGKKGGRKSNASGTGNGAGTDDGTGTPSKGGKELGKAARRKEQNRAAQKAFRERREARVNDVSAVSCVIS